MLLAVDLSIIEKGWNEINLNTQNSTVMLEFVYSTQFTQFQAHFKSAQFEGTNSGISLVFIQVCSISSVTGTNQEGEKTKEEKHRELGRSDDL